MDSPSLVVTSKYALASLVAGLGLALTGCSTAQQAAVTPSAPPERPSPIALSPSEDPSDTPEATNAPDVALVTGADVDVLARLENPTTGETWHEPTEVGDLEFLDYSARYFDVGSRGDATIYMAVSDGFEFYDGGYTNLGLFEDDDTGTREILCPSARSDDACLDVSADWLGADVTLDRDTHYDSLTYPHRVSLSEQWTLKTDYLSPLLYDDGAILQSSTLYGNANEFPGVELEASEAEFLGREDPTTLARLGESTLIEYQSDGFIAGTREVQYALVTPFDSVILVPPSSIVSYAPEGARIDGYGAAAVVWDDGVDSFTHPAPDWSEHDTYVARVLPASEACFDGHEVLDPHHRDADWVEAGSNSEGASVYLPIPEGNQTAASVWKTLKDGSWGEKIEADLAYPYDDYEDFLDARSVFTWDRGDGTWVLGIDEYASQRVYECS